MLALRCGDDGEVRLAVMVVLAVVAEEPLGLLFCDHRFEPIRAEPIRKKTINNWSAMVSIT